ncbi:MAG: hypothetical protein ACRDXX_00200 [Stackebrandtia sp.]
MDALSRNAELTVPADGLDEQIDKLYEKPRLVVLAATAEAGQGTAAKYLAYHLNTKRRNGELATTLETEEDDWRLVELLDLQPERAVVIVDYSESTKTAMELGKEIEPVPPLLDEKDQYLILLVSQQTGDRFTSRQYVHTLGRPRATEVFVRQASGQVPEQLLRELQEQQWLSQQLENAWPPVAARLASLTIQLHHSGVKDPVELVRQLRDVHGDWTVQLEEDYGGQDNGEVCALMLGAALFEGGALTTMVDAGDVLLRTSKWNSQPVHPLEQLSPHHRLKALEAEPRFDVGQRRFARAEYGAAVIPYVWRTFPRLQPHLRNWLSTLPFKLSTLPYDDRKHLVSRILGIARHKDTGIKLLREVAESWITCQGVPQKAPQPYFEAAHAMAIELLDAAAVDRKLGHRVRRVLYDWAYGEGAGIRQKQAVAEVCRGQLSKRYPLNALTRLKHLASHDDRTVRNETHKSLLSIGEEIGIGSLLRYLREWLDPHKPRRAESVLRLLEDTLSDPDTLPILLGPIDETRLGDFWARLLKLLDLTQLEHLARMVAAAAAESSIVKEAEEAVERLVELAADDQRSYDSLLYASSQFAADRWRSFDGVERFLLRMQIQLKECRSPALRTAAATMGQEAT